MARIEEIHNLTCFKKITQNYSNNYWNNYSKFSEIKKKISKSQSWERCSSPADQDGAAVATQRWTAVATRRRSNNGHGGKRMAHRRTATERKLQRRQRWRTAAGILRESRSREIRERKCCWRKKMRESVVAVTRLRKMKGERGLLPKRKV